MLASGVHAQPGVYALLIGSGVSRAAGIPTGWEIVKDLVRRVAVADNADDKESHGLAESDPESWWQQHGEGELGYSSLLHSLASTPAARQGILAKYFVASDEDREAGRKEPTAAHRAIAQLAKAGWVKVVIATNFDRLAEQALDTLGVTYQVISRHEAIRAATPLAHGIVTVIKLHGDWTDLDTRNTIDELSAYPEPWTQLLSRVFNEYGLLISGWSADWDKALVHILESTPRRYPLYWDSRSSRGYAARNLLAQHGGHIVESDDADSLFTLLNASVEALQQLAEPPLSTAMAIARLKRALPNPLRRIELRDMVLDSVHGVFKSLAGKVPTTARDWATMDAYLDTLLEATKPLLALVVQGVRYDDGSHINLWVEALQSLLDGPPAARQPAQGIVQQPIVQTVEGLRNYPALLALRAMSIEAIGQGRDDLLLALLTIPQWDDPFHSGRSTVAADVLHLLNVIDRDFADGLPRWNGGRWQYPSSHLLKTALADFFSENGMDWARYEDLCHDVEYRTGLVQHLLPQKQGRYSHGPNAGEFVGEGRWVHVSNNWDDVAPSAEMRFRKAIDRFGDGGWRKLLAPEQSLDDTLLKYREILKAYNRRL
ncbi:SIR2 family protein [[Mycobacterium] crassicus]|uniref:SIR2 family protein n=1 Tax=[Mycobacterium] crassicus TaxID=2872309 RepID=A0ABU5XQS3_9MYCO|nr:SIR2 family protein [Mycolicibacter sp. MYC098]MEB3024102.1 SIR2 family protein [Mycolicibacter sp. MYC098]